MQCVAGSLSIKMSHLMLAACLDASPYVRSPSKPACVSQVNFIIALVLAMQSVIGSVSM